MWFSAKRNVPIYKPRASKPNRVNIRKSVSAVRSGKESRFSRWAQSIDWPVWRINTVITIFCLLWGILWLRAWYLQMVAGPHLADKARRQHVATELVSGKRGIIADRNGQVLARSVEVRSIYAKPGEIADLNNTVKVLAPILGKKEAVLREELSKSDKKFIWIKRKVGDSVAEAVRNAGLPGIGLSREFERFYPFKHMAGQLLGFVGMDDRGLEGLERALDGRLGSMPVRQIVQRDAMGRRFYLHESGRNEPAGEDITLTLDMQVQFMAEEAVAKAAKEFDARWSGALVVEIETGNILAWAQYPFFNPNAYRESSPSIYRNRLAADALEPGSTLKPLVMAMALQEKKITPNTLIDCEGGKWETKNFLIRDTSIRGILPASKVLRYSSNIGMAKIGLGLGSNKFYKYMRDLGFGDHSPVPVADSRGIVRKPKDWGEVDLMSAAFGQSVSVTGLQMAQAYLTLLNGGVYKPIRLLAEAQDVEEAPRRIFDARHTGEVMDMMRDVVEAADGTGKRARVEGVEIAGKTGTAQKADVRTGTYGDSRLASFVGFFPAKEPRYFILVLVDEPEVNPFGGIVAAPAFQCIAKKLLSYSGILNDSHAGMQKTRNQRRRGLKLATAPGMPWTGSLNMAAARQSMQLPGHLARPACNVPDVKGKSVRNAVELFARAGIVPELKGDGNKVIRQSPPAGTPWPDPEKKAGFILWLSER